MQRLGYATRREGRGSRGNQRALAPALAAALIAVVAGAVATGCTAGSPDEGSAADAKPGTGTAVAQPGKFRTLLEPCGAVDNSTLRKMLPGLAELPEDQQRQRLRGEATGTFDTERRVGCSWRAESTGGAVHTLTLDFERVVSYDPEVSDNDRAQEVYARKQSAALPGSATGAATGTAPSTGQSSMTTVGSPSGSSSASTGATGSTGDEGTGGTPDPDGTGSDGEDGAALEPRVLDDLGDAAFLNDVRSTGGGGSTAPSRTVSVVFRTSNVVATVVYREQAARVTDVPDSKELQDRARNLAEVLVGEVGD
ncbi:hypothetical protein [Streptomyces yaizuensis]|uniref:DUF3558 domain-containing protein n=1 Tax=Streptomyces yaizuensis TaxID=2989713 RepID=A0ABQ5P4C1_9ACTN|nr:hypothetical protein [Streptomyces sp. YSPA8]GLF97422.1 DUF3558 domain-containing protein [Streptomyces sp. YSPA8]